MFNKFQQENQSPIALNIDNTKPEHIMWNFNRTKPQL